MSGRTEVSVVLPAYNEATTLEGTVSVALDALAGFLPAGSYEVLVAEDGCDDATPEIAARLAAEDDRVRHVHSEERLGRGAALERAFRAADGDTLAYFDTDLATDVRHLEELVEAVRTEGYDVATGSRWVPGREADRPARRGVPSRGYNLLVRALLRSDVRDHQCGFKAFDREALFALLPDVGDDHWFWDTEVLVRAQREGYRVREFPVDWEPRGDSKVDLVRDVLGMGSQVLRTVWELEGEPRVTSRTTAAAGVVLVALALALMVQYIDPGAVVSGMARADRGLVAAAAAVYLVSWPVRGARYRDILAELGYEESVGFLTGAVFVSQTGNLVFPARAGDAVRAYVVKTRRRVPYPTGFASLAVERVFDLLTIAVVAGVTLVGLSAAGVANLAGLRASLTAGPSGRVAVLTAAAVGAAALAAAALVLWSARSEHNVVRAGLARASTDAYADRVADVVERFAGDVQRVAGDRRSFGRVGGASAVIWLLDVATAVLVLAAFEDVAALVVAGTVTPVVLVAVGLFAVCVGNLAKVLPLSPNGVGLYEGAFAGIVWGLTPVGFEVALGAAILDHAVKNLLTVGGGVTSMLALNVSLTRAVEESPEAAGDVETTTDD